MWTEERRDRLTKQHNTYIQIIYLNPTYSTKDVENWILKKTQCRSQHSNYPKRTKDVISHACLNCCQMTDWPMPSGMWSTDPLTQCMDLDCSILLSAKKSGDPMTYLFVRANVHVYITRLKMRTYVSTNEVSKYCDMVTADASSVDTIYSRTSTALQCCQTILWSTS